MRRYERLYKQIIDPQSESEVFANLLSDNDSKSFYLMAIILIEDKKYDLAYKYLLQAAIFNNSAAQYTLGEFHLSDIYGYQNVDLAMEWFLKSADNSNSEALWLIARYYITSNDSTKINIGLDYLLKAAVLNKKILKKQIAIYLDSQRMNTPQGYTAIACSFLNRTSVIIKKYKLVRKCDYASIL